MDYSRYNKPELVKLAKERDLAVDASARGNGNFKKPTSQDYRNALRDADNHPPFRFMNLPADLRILIYEELFIMYNKPTPHPAKELGIKINRIIAHPEILATCKQIHKEAAHILYEDNIIKLRFTQYNIEIQGRIHGKIGSDRLFAGDFLQLSWPKFLQKVRRLSVEFYGITNLADFRGNTRGLEGAFYSLCSFLGTSSRLQDLQVDSAMNLNHPKFAPSIKIFYYPLYMLRHVPSIEVGGCTQEQMKSFMHREELSTGPALDFTACKSVLCRAISYQLLNIDSYEFKPGRWAVDQLPTTHERYFPKIEVFEEVYRFMSRPEYIDANWERTVASFIPLIKDRLAELDFIDLDRQYRAMMKERPWRRVQSKAVLEEQWQMFQSAM